MIKGFGSVPPRSGMPKNKSYGSGFRNTSKTGNASPLHAGRAGMSLCSSSECSCTSVLLNHMMQVTAPTILEKEYLGSFGKNIQRKRQRLQNEFFLPVCMLPTQAGFGGVRISHALAPFNTDKVSTGYIKSGQFCKI
jgi:hypothetical protein